MNLDKYLTPRESQWGMISPKNKPLPFDDSEVEGEEEEKQKRFQPLGFYKIL